MAFLLRAAIRPAYLLLSALFILFGGGTAALVLLQINYADRVFPGVRLQGADLSGKTVEEVFQIALAKAAVFRAPAMTLRVGDRALAIQPADVGMELDPAATAQRAWEVGRSGDLANRLRSQIETWWNGIDIAPVVNFDDRAVDRLVALLSGETQQAPRDAGVMFENGVALEIVSRAGIALDAGSALRLIRAAIATGKRADLTLPLVTLQPRVSSAADAVAAAARIMSQDVVVMAPRWDDADQLLAPVEAVRIRAAELSNYLVVDQAAATGTVSDTRLAVRLDRDRFRPLIEPLAAMVNQAPQNARFEFDDRTGQLRAIWPGRNERGLDVEATLDAVEAALGADQAEHRATAVVAVTAPPIPATATAQQLGITGLITQATTFFKGSSAPRLANIKVAASRFHGVVIPPGATFSFNQFLGDVSTQEGFEEGLIIVGDRTIKGVGGGVCQVSTTAFQAALRAGFPIVERYPHGYRVSYYERGMGPGFDAAVFSPVVDMKFVNDSPGHLLIETYYDQARATLTFKFYGTPDGRQVFFSAPEITNVVPHGPDIYEPDPEGKLPEGKAKQVEFAVDGATAAFQRTVTRDGQTLIDERVASKYAPWQARYQFGPGFTPPEGAEVKAKPD